MGGKMQKLRDYKHVEKNGCLISTKLHLSLITSSQKNTNQDEVCYKNGEIVAKNLYVWGKGG